MTSTRNQNSHDPGDGMLGSLLVGGSGSTGSSLLRTVFNRHSAVFSGEELNFFNKQQYYDDWTTARKRIFARNYWTIPRTHGWFEYSGNGLLHPSYCWHSDELRSLIDETNSLPRFAARFFDRPLRKHGKSIWMEKTPSNCYCFNSYLDKFESGKVIHTSRDPLEAVCSLVRRGMTPYFASALWIYNSCAALSASTSERYLQVRYEDLTSDPAKEIRRICNFLSIDNEDYLLEKSGADTDDHISNEGWRFGRNDPIAIPESEFHKLERPMRHAIVTALSYFRVSASHALAGKMDCMSCEDASQRLGYDFQPARIQRKHLSGLKSARFRDLLRRTIRMSPTGGLNYPISGDSL